MWANSKTEAKASERVGEKLGTLILTNVRSGFNFKTHITLATALLRSC